MKEKLDLRSKIIVGVTIACFAISVIIVVVTNITLSSAQKQYEKNDQLIDSLTKQYFELDTTDTETVEEIQVKLSSAATAGNAVATLQNKYSTFDIGQTQGMESFQSNALAIGEYLTRQEQRVPWYDAPMNEVKYEWVFESTYSFNADSIPVLWTCRDINADDILAYATGVYAVETGKFDKVEYHMTKIGSDYIPGTDSIGVDKVFETPDNIDVEDVDLEDTVDDMSTVIE